MVNIYDLIYTQTFIILNNIELYQQLDWSQVKIGQCKHCVIYISKLLTSINYFFYILQVRPGITVNQV